MTKLFFIKADDDLTAVNDFIGVYGEVLSVHPGKNSVGYPEGFLVVASDDFHLKPGETFTR